MRVVHTTLRYPPASGGVENYVEQLVKRTRYQTGPDGVLITNDPERFDVRVLTSRLRTHGPISELAPENLLNDPPHVQRLHHFSPRLISYPWLQALPYYIGHHQPNIIHAHGFWYQPTDVAARYAKKHHLPFVFNPYYYNHGPRQKLIWRLYQSTIGRATFAVADAVIVISPQEQKLIEQAGLPAQRFVLIPPGLDHAEFTKTHDRPFSFTGPVILSAGRLSQDKALHEIISALPAILKQIPDAQYAIVGEDFGARRQLEEQAIKLGVENHVHFLGKINRAELIAAYQHADLLIHPSRYEAFGIVLAESLAAGTPIVARNVGAVPYVAPHQQASLLFKSKAEMTRNIIALLKHKDLCHRLGKSGQHYVQQNFSWEGSIRKLVSLYHELTQ